jgi:sugar/nucleoside kinase (ribokinase family)
LAHIDLYFPNQVELTAITGEANVSEAIRALENGRTLTVAKLGEKGAIALVDGKPIQVSAPPVQTVDTTGAGDSFNAGFLHAWLQQKPLVECLRSGVACGSLSTRRLGGTEAQPDPIELQRFSSELSQERLD